MIKESEVPANVTGGAVVGTGDTQVHWKKSKRKKRRTKMLSRIKKYRQMLTGNVK